MDELNQEKKGSIFILIIKIVVGVIILCGALWEAKLYFFGQYKYIDVAVDKPVVNEKNVEKPKVEEVLPSFLENDIKEFGLRAVFVQVKKVYENGDNGYYFEPFGMSFVVPAKYSQYYVMDTIYGGGSTRSIDFLEKEDFANPPVVDAADSMVSIWRMDKKEYDDFNKTMTVEGVVSGGDIGIEWAELIAETDFHKVFIYKSFGNTKIYNYIFRHDGSYYDFHAPDSKKDFIEAIIKSVKFGNNL